MPTNSPSDVFLEILHKRFVLRRGFGGLPLIKDETFIDSLTGKSRERVNALIPSHMQLGDNFKVSFQKEPSLRRYVLRS